MQISTVVDAGSSAIGLVSQLIAAMQLELIVLVLAFSAHAVIFGKRRTGGGLKASKQRGQGGGTAGPPSAGPEESSPVTERAALKAALQAADLDAVLACVRGVTSGTLFMNPQGLLQQLVRLAQQNSAVPALLEAFQERCFLRTVCLCNALMDALVECEDLASAERVFSNAARARTADAVTYNTIIKARLAAGNPSGARKAVEAMRSVGLQPNCVTFNELLDATINTNTSVAWALIEEMKACGLQPNRITCSILLKGVQQGAKAQDADRTLAVVDGMGDEMDEVLLSSTLEACIRVNRTDLLAKQLLKHREEKKIQVKGAQTFGSVIRAYGCVGDLGGIKKTWREMRSRQIPLTSITLGCTVEALSANGDPDAAHGLIREVLADGPKRPVVNAVTYCSVVKGYSHQKRFNRVWAVYEEMLAEDLQGQFTSVTYNTLIDACSRCGEISRTPALLNEMLKQGIEPNLVTYSAVLKGYCQDNQLEKARELLDTMKQSRHVRPDEQTYNTLLDGCARQNLYKQGMEVFEEMKANGVKPSNFTLSILVKLANRGKQLSIAFQLCEELPRTYGFRLNIHVYNNLLQACITQREMQRAMAVLVEMLQEKVRPDVRTYTLLLRGSVTSADGWMADGLLRAALGLEKPHPDIARFGALLKPREALPTELISEVIDGIARQGRYKEMALELTVQLRKIHGLRLAPQLSMTLARRAMDERKTAA
mmetsp:Transcript_108344/g.288304  ORF Transcript_108344/g.288304 Transcript_108344/m.288304 type:complete len:713 (-) Transcript_108344:88-2226(-)